MDEKKIEELRRVLSAQNELLGCMLEEQAKIHNEVRNRNWADLQKSISDMNAFSDAFVQLDERRVSMVGQERSIYFLPEVQDLFVEVRTKLSKSKIENEALSRYVDATRSFINGVMEECVPRDRNTLYGSNGKIIRPKADSVFLDAVF